MKNRNWEYGLSTDQGPCKSINEDRCFLRLEDTKENHHCVLAIIADGMGGYGAGDYASQLAVDRVKVWWSERISALAAEGNHYETLDEELSAVIQQINDELYSSRYEKGHSPGTTLSILIVLNEEYFIFHTGDSRIYLVSDRSEEGWMIQITLDQSWVAEEVRQGRLEKSNMNSHPRRNVLTHCLGVDQSVHLYRTHGRIKVHDLFLLCSDGFYALFQDNEILQILCNMTKENSDLQDVSDRLVQLAYEKGTKDNISCMLLRPRADDGFKFVSFMRKIFKRKGR